MIWCGQDAGTQCEGHHPGIMFQQAIRASLTWSRPTAVRLLVNQWEGRKLAHRPMRHLGFSECGELDLCVLMNRVDIERLNSLIGLSSSG